ncbi:MAG TPA: phage antirepressor KilAC domain-containing protein [Candidatus Limiplasma sp.]|nr:phage antirepressor KilAC domain-containing protein [Candidatus Limiplasma sp.]
MNGLQVFFYGEREVRTIQRDSEPWFAGKDVCAVFGDTNHNRSLSRVTDEDKTVIVVSTPAGVRNVIFVSESGLYDLLFSMQPQKANIGGVQDAYPTDINERIRQLHSFRRWVTHEVLPSIRKHDAYLTHDKLEEVLSDPDAWIRVLTALKDEHVAKEALRQQAAVDKPKVVFADAVAVSDGTILIGELAKILKGNGIEIGQNRLFEQLRQDGFLIRRRGTDYNAPTQKAMELGLFKVKETAITHSDGHVTISKTTKITGKGQQYFVNYFLGGGGGVA